MYKFNYDGMHFECDLNDGEIFSNLLLKFGQDPALIKIVADKELYRVVKTEELLMMAIADLDAQREQDKLEQQLAMAELAETMMGGTF